jgi:hypothetical protein
VIVTIGPVGVGLADGDAGAAAVPDEETPPTYFTTVVVLVQAARANVSTDTATPPAIVRIPDMSPPFPVRYGTRPPPMYELRTDGSHKM